MENNRGYAISFSGCDPTGSLMYWMAEEDENTSGDACFTFDAEEAMTFDDISDAYEYLGENFYDIHHQFAYDMTEDDVNDCMSVVRV